MRAAYLSGKPAKWGSGRKIIHLKEVCRGAPRSLLNLSVLLSGPTETQRKRARLERMGVNPSSFTTCLGQHCLLDHTLKGRLQEDISESCVLPLALQSSIKAFHLFRGTLSREAQTWSFLKGDPEIPRKPRCFFWRPAICRACQGCEPQKKHHHFFPDFTLFGVVLQGSTHLGRSPIKF